LPASGYQTISAKQQEHKLENSDGVPTRFEKTNLSNYFPKGERMHSQQKNGHTPKRTAMP
jgi:hypothetical protein